MTGEHEHWHGLIASEVVGQLDDDERISLEAHVDQCDTCRDERRSMASLAQAMEGAHPDHIDPEAMPLSLEHSVLAFLRDAEHRTTVSRQLRYALLAAAAAACVVVAVMGLGFAGSTSGRTVALSGTGATRATAMLSAQSWGTSVRLTETDPHTTTTLTVWMRTRSGGWWEAGTYRVSMGRSVDVTMACAVPTPEITGLSIRNPRGHTVLQGSVS